MGKSIGQNISKNLSGKYSPIMSKSRYASETSWSC